MYLTLLHFNYLTWLLWWHGSMCSWINASGSIKLWILSLCHSLGCTYTTVQMYINTPKLGQSVTKQTMRCTAVPMVTCFFLVLNCFLCSLFPPGEWVRQTNDAVRSHRYGIKSFTEATQLSYLFTFVCFDILTLKRWLNHTRRHNFHNFLSNLYALMPVY